MLNGKQNLHIHTIYADGNDTPEELIVEAIKRNFGSIGFSEHTYNRHSPSPRQMAIERMGEYRDEIRSLKAKYADQIDVFCGLEDEFYSEVSLDGYDYLIASVHYLDVGGKIAGFDRGLEETQEYIDTYFAGSGLKFAKKYFETLALFPEKGRYDIIGHFDLITKNNEKGHFIDIASKEYLDYGLEAIHALKGKIPFFEVNTGAIARGYRTSPYPQVEFLQEFNRCGFGVVITSDCHNKTFLDCFYKEAADLVAQAGFRSKWILTGNGFREVAL